MQLEVLEQPGCSLAHPRDEPEQASPHGMMVLSFPWDSTTSSVFHLVMGAAPLGDLFTI